MGLFRANALLITLTLFSVFLGECSRILYDVRSLLMYTPSLSEYTFYYLVLSDFEQDGKNFAGGPVCFVSSRRMYYEDPVVCNSAPPGIAHKPKKELPTSKKWEHTHPMLP